MKFRHYCDKDYSKLCSWLNAIDWPIIPRESIAPLGVVIHDNDVEMGFAFIYGLEKHYDFIFPSLILPNPDAPFKKLTKIMDAFAEAFDDIALEYKKTHIFITTETHSIINYFGRKHNYHAAERNITRLVKCIEPQKAQDLLFWYDQEGIDEYFPDHKYASK